ncbi:MAG: tRNA pseudouridine(38-40) synthase TruA [Clostridiales bacterium]|nr:tRNA pseudouridine(38-40) synthase TruA [Clostridiales bacterium]
MNYLLKITYDGKNYHGWQIQENALTVQEVFQKALNKILNAEYEIKGCSRTDSGVHANEYYVNVKTERKIPPHRLKAALNGNLPSDVAVLDSQTVSEDFHARYNCIGKQYIYKIWNSEVKNPFLDGYALHYRWHIDEDLLNKAAKYFEGKHDFTSFCTLDRRKQENMTRTVYSAGVTRNGDMIIFKIEADGFLYNMVRIMTGTLLRVAQGKFAPDDIPGIISAKSRKKAGPTAPACGLYLNKVSYKKEDLCEPE